MFGPEFPLEPKCREAEAVISPVALDDKRIPALVFPDILQQEGDREAGKIPERVIRQPGYIIQGLESMGFFHDRHLEINPKAFGNCASVPIFRIILAE